MMKATILFEIECGEKTCASEPGKFCEFTRVPANGDAYCALFSSPGKFNVIRLRDSEGWLMRHEKCLEATSKKPIWEVIEEIMADVPDEEFDKLPKDGASEHDHYIYGTPKKNDNA
jgi:hypothetical protein